MKKREEIVKEGLDKKIYKHVELLDESGIIEDLSGLKTNELAQIFNEEEEEAIDSTIELISNNEVAIDLEVNDTDLIDEYNEYLSSKGIDKDDATEEVSDKELITNIDAENELEAFEEEVAEIIDDNEVEEEKLEAEVEPVTEAAKDLSEEVEEIEVFEAEIAPETEKVADKKEEIQEKDSADFSTSEIIEQAIETSYQEEEAQKLAAEKAKKEAEKKRKEAKQKREEANKKEAEENVDDFDEDEKPDYVFIVLVGIVILAIIALVYLFITGGI